MSFDPVPPPVVQSRPQAVHPTLPTRRPDRGPLFIMAGAAVLGIVAIAILANQGAVQKALTGPVAPKASKPTEAPPKVAPQADAAEETDNSAQPRVLREGELIKNPPVVDIISDIADGREPGTQPVDPNGPRHLADDNDFTPEKKAVRAWLKDNTHTGEWEEVQWFAWKKESDGYISGRLKFRTKNVVGAMNIAIIGFYVRDGKATSVDYRPY